MKLSRKDIELISFYKEDLMGHCNICGTEQVKVNIFKLCIDGEEAGTMPQYNINLFTGIKGKRICDDCMEKYYKIDALFMDRNFSCAGKEYFSDGRNLD